MSQIIITRDYKKHSYTFTFGAADEDIEAEIDPKLGIKGELAKLIITTPNWTNDVTAVVSAINSDDKEIFADDPRARDGDYNVTVDRNKCIIMGQAGEKFKMTLSGVPGGTGGVATVTAYLEG